MDTQPLGEYEPPASIELPAGQVAQLQRAHRAYELGRAALASANEQDRTTAARALANAARQLGVAYDVLAYTAGGPLRCPGLAAGLRRAAAAIHAEADRVEHAAMAAST